MSMNKKKNYKNNNAYRLILDNYPQFGVSIEADSTF